MPLFQLLLLPYIGDNWRAAHSQRWTLYLFAWMYATECGERFFGFAAVCCGFTNTGDISRFGFYFWFHFAAATLTHCSDVDAVHKKGSKVKTNKFCVHFLLSVGIWYNRVNSNLQYLCEISKMARNMGADQTGEQVSTISNYNWIPRQARKQQQQRVSVASKFKHFVFLATFFTYNFYSYCNFFKAWPSNFRSQNFVSREFVRFPPSSIAEHAK